MKDNQEQFSSRYDNTILHDIADFNILLSYIVRTVGSNTANLSGGFRGGDQAPPTRGPPTPPLWATERRRQTTHDK